eukprot:TRINITY_DN76024_c0_g1_i1.p1 TRINITY_DN76024_c0_g1~~TRINITY_DN76024_c0_g1_i1.p1  ORF type:complete len:150 (+),score=31.21 TRINITY_DN76024_c0_g1_i1:140-589(+)
MCHLFFDERRPWRLVGCLMMLLSPAATNATSAEELLRRAQRQRLRGDSMTSSGSKVMPSSLLRLRNRDPRDAEWFDEHRDETWFESHDVWTEGPHDAFVKDHDVWPTANPSGRFGSEDQAHYPQYYTKTAEGADDDNLVRRLLVRGIGR